MSVADKAGALDWALFADERGWPLCPLADWLVTQAHHRTGMESLIDGLAEHLRDAGAEISRLRIATMTLHPLVRAWGAEWDRVAGSRGVEFPFGAMDTSSYRGSPVEQVRHSGQPLRRRLDGPLGPADHLLLHELKADGLTDYCAVPLSGSADEGAFCSFATDRRGGFDDLDLAKLAAVGQLLAPVVQGLNRRLIASSLLDTYVGRRAGARVLAGHIQRGDCEEIRAAFWYSDLRGFTPLNETLPPDQLLDLLNTYFSVVTDAILPRGGEVLQFIGDAVLGVFECEPTEADTKAACEAAFDGAIEALDRIAAINRTRSADGLPEIRFGIGLHVGDVTFGNVGAESRLSFNVVGPAVNLTARLETLSKQALVPLLMSSPFAAMVDRPLWPVGNFQLKGIRELQAVFTAAALVDDHAGGAV